MKRRFAKTSRKKYNYPYRWHKMARQHKAENPLCVQCLKEGRHVPAQVTDHIIPHRGNSRLRWDWDNLQSLCKVCHDKKTKKGL